MAKSPVAYEIIEELGQGGMCVVYRAWHLARGKMVALKMPKPSLLSDIVGLKRFVREAQLNSRLNHPNIVEIYEIDESDGVPFISMEYVNGVTLLDIFKAEPSLPMTLHLVKQVVEALAYAHEQEVIHRDLKPSNILVDNDLRVRVADWGMAKALGDTWGLTKTGIIVGTPDYMAPEQLKDEEVSSKTDLYALGLILFEMVSHKRPFSEDNLSDRVRSRLSARAPLLSQAYPEAPPSLVSLVSDLLMRNQAERPNSARLVAKRLDEVEKTMRLGGALCHQGATVKIARRALEERRDSSGDDSSNYPLPSSIKRRMKNEKGGKQHIALGFAFLVLVLSALFLGKSSDKPTGMSIETPKCTVRLLSLTKANLSCRHLPPGEFDVVTRTCDGKEALTRQNLSFPKGKIQLVRELTLPRGTGDLMVTISPRSGGKRLEVSINRQKLINELLEPLSVVTEKSFIRIARPLASYRAQVGNKPGEDVQKKLLEVIEPIGLDLKSLQAIKDNIEDFGPVELGTPVARQLLVLRRLESLLQERKFQPLPWGKIAPHLGCVYHQVGLNEVSIDCNLRLPLTPLRGRKANGKFEAMSESGFVRISTEKRLAVMDQSTSKGALSHLLNQDDSVDRLELQCVIKDNVAPWPPKRLRLAFTCFALFPDFELTFHVNGNPIVIHNLAGIIGTTRPDILDRKHSIVADLSPRFLKRGKNSIVLSCRDLPGARAMNRLSMWTPVYFLFGGPLK